VNQYENLKRGFTVRSHCPVERKLVIEN